MQDTLSPTIEAPADELAQARARIAELEAEGLPPELAKQVAEALADSHRGDVIYLGPAVGLGAGRP